MMWKQSPGVAAARIGSGLSELRPYIAASRSACSIFVGMPGRRAGALDVDDHDRQLGHYGEADRLLLQMKPGPLVVHMPRWPAYDAPIAALAAAISSSAWNVLMPKLRKRATARAGRRSPA